MQVKSFSDPDPDFIVQSATCECRSEQGDYQQKTFRVSELEVIEQSRHPLLPVITAENWAKGLEMTRKREEELGKDRGTQPTIMPQEGYE
jgi:hypothetical protein